jgi:hypothetical protein
MTENEIAPSDELNETVIQPTDFFNQFYQATEQDHNPPRQEPIDPPKQEPEPLKNDNKSQEPAGDDDPEITDDIKLYVDAGTEMADAAKDMLCQWISGEKDTALFETNKKNLERFKRQSNRIAAVYMKKPNPMVLWWMMAAICFVLPIANAFIFRFSKKNETNPKPDLNGISNVLNDKTPGRPSKEEIILREAYEAYVRAKRKK